MKDMLTGLQFPTIVVETEASNYPSTRVPDSSVAGQAHFELGI